MSSTEPPGPAGPPEPAGPSAPVAHGAGLVRSEERLSVTTRRIPAGVARLERYRVTETRTVTVDVVREEVRLVVDRDARHPDEPGSSAAPATGPDGPWLVLSEERVVVSKQMVPVERVRLQVTPVTELQDVTATVRAERIELTGAPGAGAGPAAG